MNYTGGDTCGTMLASSRARHMVFALLDRLDKTTLFGHRRGAFTPGRAKSKGDPKSIDALLKGMNDLNIRAARGASCRAMQAA